MGTRDERVADLIFEDQTGVGNPSEEGFVRRISGDLVAYIGGSVKSLTAGAASGISEAQHKALKDLIHFIDDGPADGWASGAYKENTYSGLKVTSEVWYIDNTKVDKIASKDISYTELKATTEVWKVYAADGSTVLVTLTDSITYTGLKETSRDRTWA